MFLEFRHFDCLLDFTFIIVDFAGCLFVFSLMLLVFRSRDCNVHHFGDSLTLLGPRLGPSHGVDSLWAGSRLPLDRPREVGRRRLQSC